MTQDQAIFRRIRAIEPQEAEGSMTRLTRELDELREAILKKDRSRPDPKILLKGRAAIEQFEILAVAATRMRHRWPNAGAALDALEAWRKDWNVVASAALVHAKADLVAAEPGTEAHDRALKTVNNLIDLIAVTFRPLTGPQGKWLQVQAKAVDNALN
jgi:hypothetical protein